MDVRNHSHLSLPVACIFSLAILFAGLAPVPAWAQNGCQQLLAQLKQNGDAADLTGVTLNINNVASFISTGLQYSKAFKVPTGIRPAAYATVRREEFDAGSRAQTFSDRFPGRQSGPHLQRFDAGRADNVDVLITDTATPKVTLTLRSWGNARTSFTPTCRDGFLTGNDAAGVYYLLRLTPVRPVL